METIKNNKFLVLLFYYDRPEIVKNALHSIASMEYANYEVALINDSINITGKDITEYIEGTDCIHKFKYYDINQSKEEKTRQGGSIFGKYANNAIQESDADYVIMLCDDDALISTYLSNLNKYYNNNSNIQWAYSKVMYYNPEIETYLQAIDNLQRVQHNGSVADLNKHTTPINPDCACDASQVSFRRSCFTDNNIWFPYPQTRNLDSAIYSKMYATIGNCYPTNFYGQCKGVFPDQLGVRTQNDFDVLIK
jgi:hypothetical protein